MSAVSPGRLQVGQAQSIQTGVPMLDHTAILLVAHGSRRLAAAEELARTCSRLEARLSDDLRVRCAFLELNEPSIPDGLRAFAATGIKQILVIPYFLNSGRHASQDVPQILDTMRAELHDVAIRMLPIIGSHPGMLDLLDSLIQDAL